MHDAFEHVPILEKLPLQIDCLAAWGEPEGPRRSPSRSAPPPGSVRAAAAPCPALSRPGLGVAAPGPAGGTLSGRGPAAPRAELAVPGRRSLSPVPAVPSSAPGSAGGRGPRCLALHARPQPGFGDAAGTSGAVTLGCLLYC